MFVKNTEKYQKHWKVGLKNTKYNITWVQKTHKMQFGVFNKTLLFSVHPYYQERSDFHKNGLMDQILQTVRAIGP